MAIGRVPVNNLYDSAEQNSILQSAIKNSNYELLDFLIANNVNLNQNIKNVGTALHSAVWKKDINLVKKLVNSGADVNVMSYGNESASPLHAAVIGRNYEITEFLLKSGADINAVRRSWLGGYYKWTPLNLAIYVKEVNIVELLLKHNATMEQRSTGVYSSVQTAIRSRNIDIFQLLINFGAEFSLLRDGEYTEEFEMIITEDDLDMFQVCIKNYKDINGVKDNSYDNTILHEAAKFCANRILQYLLNCSADINSINSRKKTPFNILMTEQTKIDNELNRWSESSKILERHVVMLRAANLYVSENNLRLVSEENFDAIHRECIKEIEQMKKIKIVQTNLYCYDILHKSIHKLAVGLTNVDNDFTGEELACQFPLYGEIIFNCLRKGMERRNLLRHSSQLYEIFGNYLPSLFIRQIFEYLDNDDLKLLNY